MQLAELSNGQEFTIPGNVGTCRKLQHGKYKDESGKTKKTTSLPRGIRTKVQPRQIS